MEVYNLFYGAVYLFTGLWTGSFLNVCVWRFPRRLSPIKGRSSCPRCGHALSPGDLVPVFSWLFLRGQMPLLPPAYLPPLSADRGIDRTGLSALLLRVRGRIPVRTGLSVRFRPDRRGLDRLGFHLHTGRHLPVYPSGRTHLLYPAACLRPSDAVFLGKLGRSCCCGCPHRICAVHCLPAHRRRNRRRRHQASGRIRLLSRPPEGASCHAWGLYPGRCLGRSGTAAR